MKSPFSRSQRRSINLPALFLPLGRVKMSWEHSWIVLDTVLKMRNDDLPMIFDNRCFLYHSHSPDAPRCLVLPWLIFASVPTACWLMNSVNVLDIDRRCLTSCCQVYSLCSLTIHYQQPELVIFGEACAVAVVLASGPEILWNHKNNYAHYVSVKKIILRG